jgi:hypothetical protein
MTYLSFLLQPGGGVLHRAGTLEEVEAARREYGVRDLEAVAASLWAERPY